MSEVEEPMLRTLSGIEVEDEETGRQSETKPLQGSTGLKHRSSSLQELLVQPHALLGIGCVAISAVCFSLMSTLVKFNTFSMTSMEAVFWRSLVAFVLNFVAVQYQRTSLHVPQEKRGMLLARCITGFTSISFAFYAISQMVLADASVLVFCSPIITFFLSAFFLSERIDPVGFAAALVSFGGLICVVRPGFVFGYESNDAASTGSWIAIVSALLGALSQAFVFITVRQLKELTILQIVHYFMLFSSLMSLVYVLLFQGYFSLPSTLPLWLSIIGCGLFTFLGQIFLTKGFQLEKAGVASVMRYFDVVCVFIWDSFLLGEDVNSWSIVGAAIICSSAIVITLRQAKII